MAVLQLVLAVIGGIWVVVIALSVAALMVAVRGDRATTACPAARRPAAASDPTWLDDQPAGVLTDAEVRRRLRAIEAAERQIERRRGR